MRYLTATLSLLLAIFSFALAQDIEDDSPKCAAQMVVDQCLIDMKFQLENCDISDWGCLCRNSKNVEQCYNNCPLSNDRIGAQTIREQNCLNAIAYDTSTSISATSSKTEMKATAATFIASDMQSTMAAAAASSAMPTDTTSNSRSNKNGGIVVGPGSTQSLSGLAASSSNGAAPTGVMSASGLWVAALGIGIFMGAVL